MKPRLASTRDRLSLTDPPLDLLVSEYSSWVKYPEWLIFQGKEFRYQPWETQFIGSSPGVAVMLPKGEPVYETRYKAAKASKRGNDVYAWRVRKRMKLLHEVHKKPHTLAYFARGNVKPLTACLFITLTYQREASIGGTWADVGPDFDRWRARIRSKYGKFEFIRCWESHEDGYPHIHILLVFHDAEFTVFRYNRKYRITEKPEFEWSHGFVDVQACRDLKDGIKYIAKYIGKVHLQGGHSLTLALTWFYGKRSWSLSRAFNDLIRGLHNSNETSAFGLAQNIEGHIEWSLLGFYGGYPLQLILDEPRLGFTKRILGSQFRFLYGSAGWTDYRYKGWSREAKAYSDMREVKSKNV